MLATQTAVDGLAERIERAYGRRRPRWHGGCSTSRVWAVAAETLLRAHETDPALPVDPELFVASQPADPEYPDPWVDLTGAGAVRRYRARVRQIVRRLRVELTGEVREAEGRIGAGQAIGRVLAAKSLRLSPLARYIVARRAGRAALAEQFRPGAVSQHESCPLYRQACTTLLSSGCYPAPEAPPQRPSASPPKYRARPTVHLN